MARRAEPRWYESRQGWYVELGGKQYLLAKGKAGKPEAFAAFHRLMAEGASPARRVELSVQVMMDLFLDGTREAISPATHEGYCRRLQSFVDQYGASKAADIRPFHLSRWLDSHPAWNDSTRFGYVTAVKRAYSWARRQGHLEINPIEGASKPTMGRRSLVLTSDQAGKVIEHAAKWPRFQELLVGLWNTGCRPAEAATLTADRVDLAAGIWIVSNKTRHATGEEFRPVPLSDRAMELSRMLLERHPEGLIFRNARGNAWTRHAMSCAFEQIRRDLGYGHEVVAYAFRHRYATDALLRGVSAETLGTIMGHKSTTMIMRVYSHMGDEHAHLRQAARKIRPSESPGGEGA